MWGDTNIQSSAGSFLLGVKSSEKAFEQNPEGWHFDKNEPTYQSHKMQGVSADSPKTILLQTKFQPILHF